MDITVGEKYRRVVGASRTLEETLGARKDSHQYQKQLYLLIQEFEALAAIVDSLSLFSDNEPVEEINTNYLPFANLPFYVGRLYGGLLTDARGALGPDKLEHKPANLAVAKNKLVHFLLQLERWELLTNEQKKRIESFKEVYNPSYGELVAGNPADRRAHKIANHKLEKQLRARLDVLHLYYGSEEGDELLRLDEEVVRAVFVDELKYHSIEAFAYLEQLALELDVLSRRPANDKRVQPKKEESDSTGFTTRLEELPFKQKKVGDLISRQGKILQPFTITNKQELRKKVFGTGQVLPSMTVEEYLDYELANGKMLKDEPQLNLSDDEAYDSDKELEERLWDDWKDDNPKGAGNMGSNLG